MLLVLGAVLENSLGGLGPLDWGLVGSVQISSQRPLGFKAPKQVSGTKAESRRGICCKMAAVYNLCSDRLGIGERAEQKGTTENEETI